MKSSPPPPLYKFAPEERPLFPGGPYSPHHPPLRRVGYGLVALVMALAATLGNALVTVNLPSLSGALGVYQVQASLLPAAYVAMNASANLLLIKARQQFGIPAVTHALLTAYVAAVLLQFAAHGFWPALLVRAVSGMTAAGLTTMTIYNFLQTVPPAKRPLALVSGISLSQFGTPLARLFPVEMLALNHWQGLHFIELALGLTALAALIALPLPPSDRSPAFERLDFVTIGLAMPAIVLFCGVLGVGRVVWWTDAPVLGIALAVAVPLFVGALLIEHNRARPLLQTKWIGTRDIARFAVVAVLVRLALAEQTYGAVGLLTSASLTNDQLRVLFVVVMIAMAAGLATVLLLLTPPRIPYLLMAATAVIALGAWLDSHSTNVTRPAQLMWSQALLGYGTLLFIGPALGYGFLRMLEKGPGHLVTFIVLFSSTQNIGGLAGAALLGTYQVAAARHHALALAERVLPADPQAADRLRAGSGLLTQALLREANVLAFNDVFRFVTVMALMTLAYLVYIRTYNIIRQRRTLAGATP